MNPVEAMRWACERFVWAPELGMGYYPVSEQPYDAEYFAKYAEYAKTPMGVAITQARVDLVERHAPGALVVDIGIGSGDFVETRGGSTYGFDVNLAGVRWLEERAKYWDPDDSPVPVLTFWDSLEHIPAAAAVVARAQEWVFCSLPIVPGDGPPRMDWKHLRKDEHCWYWTRAGLIRWMRDQGFHCIECNAAEVLLGREDVESFAFRRVR